MRRTFLAIFLAACLSTAVVVSPGATRGDQPRRANGHPVVAAPARVPYYRHYSFAPRGRHGSPYYRIANGQIFGPAAAYIPYGAPVAGGYLAPPSYYALAYSGYPGGAYGYGPGAALDWNPYSNPLLQATMLENQLRWGNALPPGYAEPRARNRPHPSSPEQKAKSLRAQLQGDVWMKKLRFLNAYERYKVAQSAAPDRPEPYFRLGFSLTAAGNFDSAVKYFKQGLDIDPRWPSHGDRIDVLFGEDNRLSVLTMTERVGGWVREDIRDPDRLFLIGIVLFFDGDSRSSEFFEYAYRLSGGGDHLLAFLRPNGPGPAGAIPPGAVWNGSNPGGPPAATPYGVPNGGSPAPQAQEPAGAGPPQMVAPPDFGPPGDPQGLFSPPRSVPRGLYQPDANEPIPQRSGNRPIPGSPVTPPAAPPQAAPQPSTPQTAPQGANPAVPQLPPVPPLPAPEEPSAQGSAPSGPQLEGPSLGPPTGPPGATGGNTTAQSP
jgi:hypothetical protein